MNLYRQTQALIHLKHLEENVRLLKSLPQQNGFFCPMVKANAYGHGDLIVAEFLQKMGVERLGVGLIEEALRLRTHQIDTEILFFGIAGAADVKVLKQNKITPVVSTWDLLHEMVKQPLPFHLKIDTGMHRLGFSQQELPSLLQFFRQNFNLKPEAICTHLHSAEDLSSSMQNGTAFRQLELLKNNCDFLGWPKILTHSLNSAGLIGAQNLPSLVGLPTQGARPGLAIYGYCSAAASVALKPVMSLRSQIVKYHKISKQDGFSYGHRYKVARDSHIAVLPIGYADGYHRSLGDRAFALFRGQKVPVRGSVCMDYLMVDVTDAAAWGEIKAGEWVTLFGYDEEGNCLPATELAVHGETIAWEILTSISQRVPRVIDVG